MEGRNILVSRTTGVSLDDTADNYIVFDSMTEAKGQYNKWLEDDNTLICTISVVHTSSDYPEHPIVRRDRLAEGSITMHYYGELNDDMLIDEFNELYKLK